MFISGIQQIGIGVANVHEAFKWYRQTFGMDVPIFEEAAVAGLMLPYTGGHPQARHAILALNLHGGGGMEIWQYTGRQPQLPAFQPQLGDLGLFAAKIKCADVEACFHQLRRRGVTLVTNPALRPDGVACFFVKDPWGNLFEVVQATDWLDAPAPTPPTLLTQPGEQPAVESGRPVADLKQEKRILTGGVYGAVIGVSDVDRSLKFYREVLGYDQVVYDQIADFADWHGVDGSFGRHRRVLLRHSEPRVGPFSRLLGASEIELVQSLDHTGRRIFEGRLWGDLGFIHLCFDITGMAELKECCAAAGHPFTVDSSGSFDMGEAAGYFSYVEDPDGTLIEFVETHKIPILKKLGWYLDLRRRKRPEKPLPRLMLKALGLGRVKD